MNPLSIFFKKQYVVEEKIQRLLRYLEDMAHLYQETYKAFLDGRVEDLTQGNTELGKIEKELDDLGRQIQMSLLHESLMPDSRDDLLWFLTKMDKVPSSFKHSLSDIVLEKPEIPEDFHLPLKDMLGHTHDAVKALANATDALFSDLRAVRQHVEEVGRQESMVDKIEYKLLQSVFEDEKFELARKYQLKGIFKQLGAVTNLAEDVADAVLILATKHST
jgi:predicted phosphate transport protein (TIGR00153 family)